MATEQRLEGIVSKRASSAYHAGRSSDWLKIKRLESDEFAVVGYTHPKGSRTGFGSLLLARPDPKLAGGWIYAGRVGSGFTDLQLRELSKTLANKGSKDPTVKLSAIDPELRGALWVRPTAVAEVFYRGIGNNNLLRQPSLKTLRTDKAPDDLTRPDRSSGAKKALPVKNKNPAPDDGAPIVITHPDRVVFPDDGITKQDVANYYAAVMEWFLPGVIDRPTSVIRCPEGTAKPCFFQKHLVQGLHHVGTAKLKEESGTQAVYIYPQNAASVIELVQFGALEFHPWGATVENPDQADGVVFDLDPGPNVAWDRVVAAARLVRSLLKPMGLESFLRTTGGKGLHVVVPLRPSCAWPAVNAFRWLLLRRASPRHTRLNLLPPRQRRSAQGRFTWTTCATVAARPASPRILCALVPARLWPCRYVGMSWARSKAARRSTSSRCRSVSRGCARTLGLTCRKCDKTSTS